MRVVVGMATTAERAKYARIAKESLEANTISPEVWIYNNGVNSQDLTDNGKFYFLRLMKEPVYYFSCDDDILYPKDYIEKMIEDIERHQCIITHHGRILTGKDKSYYDNHYRFPCLRSNPNRCQIDVAGTGVTAFRTDYFNPIDICFSEYKKMADCVFSLEAAKNNKKIMLTPHDKGWFKDLKVPKELTIYETEHKDTRQQTKLCNEIIKLRVK